MLHKLTIALMFTVSSTAAFAGVLTGADAVAPQDLSAQTTLNGGAALVPGADTSLLGNVLLVQEPITCDVVHTPDGDTLVCNDPADTLTVITAGLPDPIPATGGGVNAVPAPGGLLLILAALGFALRNSAKRA